MGGESASSTERCLVEATQERCDRRSSCHWIITDDPSVCEWDDETTVPPYDPGCCIIADVSSGDAYDNWADVCTTYFTERQCLMPTDGSGDYRCTWVSTREDFDCETIWPTKEPEGPGCCMGDNAYSHDRCAMSGAKDHCNRISSCWWLSTTDPADCVWESTSTTPPPPGCCYLHASQNPMSRCHWIQGDEADCTWVPPTEPPPGPGCCTICASQDVNGPWLETCTNYWNEEDCLTPVDGDGVKRCSWTPTAEDVDCTILWPTEGPADSWWTTAEPAQQNLLFGFGADSKMTEAMNSRVSLLSALLMLIAALVMYKVYLL